MGSIVIGILLLVIVVGIVWKLRSDQKKGKHSCGGTCGSAYQLVAAARTQHTAILRQ